MNQKVATRLLAKYGAHPDVVANGVEAVEAVQRQPYDVILMDVQMPVMDGFTATKILREEIGVQIPIIAMTAGVLPSEQARCLDSGMSDFIAKPIDLEHATAVILRNLRQVAIHGEISATPTIVQDIASAQPRRFDPEAMLSMLAGDAALRESVLRQFVDTVALSDDELSSAIGQQDWQTSMRICHTLKGTARMIGAQILADEAETLEALVSTTHVDGIETAKHLALVGQKLAETARAVARWLAQHSAEKAEQTNAPIVPLESGAIGKLQGLLAQRNLAACDEYRKLRSGIRGHLSPQLFEHLDTAVDSLRFDEALHLLSRVAA